MQDKTIRDYVRNLKISEGNQKLIDHEFVVSNINKKLQQGLPPSYVEEKPLPTKDREEIIDFLRKVTYEPNKAYSYLYDNGEIAAFSSYMGEFYNKQLKGQKNLSAGQIFDQWKAFKALVMSKDLRIKGVPEEDIEAYETAYRSGIIGDIGEYVKRMGRKKTKDWDETTSPYVSRSNPSSSSRQSSVIPPPPPPPRSVPPPPPPPPPPKPSKTPTKPKEKSESSKKSVTGDPLIEELKRKQIEREKKKTEKDIGKLLTNIALEGAEKSNLSKLSYEERKKYQLAHHGKYQDEYGRWHDRKGKMTSSIPHSWDVF